MVVQELASSQVDKNFPSLSESDFQLTAIFRKAIEEHAPGISLFYRTFGDLTRSSSWISRIQPSMHLATPSEMEELLVRSDPTVISFSQYGLADLPELSMQCQRLREGSRRLGIPFEGVNIIFTLPHPDYVDLVHRDGRVYLEATRGGVFDALGNIHVGTFPSPVVAAVLDTANSSPDFALEIDQLSIPVLATPNSEGFFGDKLRQDYSPLGFRKIARLPLNWDLASSVEGRSRIDRFLDQHGKEGVVLKPRSGERSQGVHIIVRDHEKPWETERERIFEKVFNAIYNTRSQDVNLILEEFIPGLELVDLDGSFLAHKFRAVVVNANSANSQIWTNVYMADRDSPVGKSTDAESVHRIEQSLLAYSSLGEIAVKELLAKMQTHLLEALPRINRDLGAMVVGYDIAITKDGELVVIEGNGSRSGGIGTAVSDLQEQYAPKGILTKYLELLRCYALEADNRAPHESETSRRALESFSDPKHMGWLLSTGYDGPDIHGMPRFNQLLNHLSLYVWPHGIFNQEMDSKLLTHAPSQEELGPFRIYGEIDGHRAYRYMEGLKYFIRVDNSHFLARDLMARCLWQSGNFQEMKDFVSETVSLHPESRAAWWMYVMAEALLSERDTHQQIKDIMNEISVPHRFQDIFLLQVEEMTSQGTSICKNYEDNRLAVGMLWRHWDDEAWQVKWPTNLVEK